MLKMVLGLPFCIPKYFETIFTGIQGLHKGIAFYPNPFVQIILYIYKQGNKKFLLLQVNLLQEVSL